MKAMRVSNAQLPSADTSRILPPPLRDRLFTTARRSFFGQSFGMVANRIIMYGSGQGYTDFLLSSNAKHARWRDIKHSSLVDCEAHTGHDGAAISRVRVEERRNWSISAKCLLATWTAHLLSPQPRTKRSPLLASSSMHRGDRSVFVVLMTRYHAALPVVNDRQVS